MNRVHALDWHQDLYCIYLSIHEEVLKCTLPDCPNQSDAAREYKSQ